MQIVINGILTNYELINPKAKRTILLLHGWGQNSTFWTPLAQLLNPDLRIFLLDLPGFGGTQNLAFDSNVPDYSNFVKEFTTKLSLKKFILIGQSFGGQVAGDFALKYPNSLTKLILIDAAIVRNRNLLTIIKIYLAKIGKPIAKLFPRHFTKIILSHYAADRSKTNPYQKSVIDQILKYDLSKKIHLIKIPTDIIWGSEDRVIPYVGKLLVETFPNANLHVIYGAGHLPHLTHPTKLAAILNNLIT